MRISDWSSDVCSSDLSAALVVLCYMMLFLRLIGESFGFAFTALRENRTRPFLSLLGVTIGILIIIGVFSAVDTLRANLENSVETLASKTLYVQKWTGGGGDRKRVV